MILEDIVERTRKRVSSMPSEFPEPQASRKASLAGAIRNRDCRNAVIAEIKCSSPSKGIIRRNVDMPMMARVLAGSGCVALSILTEPCYFGGSIGDLEHVKKTVDIPVLRKDFIIDERQIAETLSLGADAILLIAAVLGDRLPRFVDLALDFGLEPLVEIHNAVEGKSALATNTDLIGINNRDLLTLTIDRSTTRILSGNIQDTGRLIVSESGMRSADDIREMRPYCDAFLIGSAIMEHRHPQEKLKEFVCA